MTFEQMLAQAKQLYNGTQELQRVYKGETMVWNRYNWEKWSCDTTTEQQTVWTDTVVLRGYNRTATDPVSSGSYDTYLTIHGYYTESGQWRPLVKVNASTYPTLGDLATAGYTTVYYFSAEDAPTYYFKIILTDASGGKYKQELHENVSSTQTVTTYSKGSTYYGVVPSVKGHYPSNGRASDGYWYVAKGAVYFGGS